MENVNEREKGYSNPLSISIDDHLYTSFMVNDKRRLRMDSFWQKGLLKSYDK